MASPLSLTPLDFCCASLSSLTCFTKSFTTCLYLTLQPHVPQCGLHFFLQHTRWPLVWNALSKLLLLLWGNVMTLPPHMVTNLSWLIWELLGFTLEVAYPRKFCSVTPFPDGSDGEVSAYNLGDSGSIPGLGRSPGEGNGNPLQDSCLENPMDWRIWTHGIAKSRTRLSDFTSPPL